MIVYDDIRQGTPEWVAIRCGRPTASHFSEVVTPSTLKLSASSRKYRLQKLAEWALGQPCESFKGSGYSARGTGLEAEAIAAYEWQHDATVRRVGFVTSDDGLIGCSPDGLIGDDGGLEVKIISAENHLDALLSKPDMNEHKAQIQGNLWICERDYWIRWYWHPTLPGLAVRFERDDVYIMALNAAFYDDHGFLALLEQDKQRLMELGFNPSVANCLCKRCKGTDRLTQVEDVGVLCHKCKTEYLTGMEEIFK